MIGIDLRLLSGRDARRVNLSNRAPNAGVGGTSSDSVPGSAAPRVGSDWDSAAGPARPVRPRDRSPWPRPPNWMISASAIAHRPRSEQPGRCLERSVNPLGAQQTNLAGVDKLLQGSAAGELRDESCLSSENGRCLTARWRAVWSRKSAASVPKRPTALRSSGRRRLADPSCERWEV